VFDLVCVKKNCWAFCNMQLTMTLTVVIFAVQKLIMPFRMKYHHSVVLLDTDKIF